MQLKFSKKSLSKETHSFLGGSCLHIGRANKSENISGFQYIILLSSTEAEDIISWKEESPVFSLTHEIPFGENMENPEDDPELISIAHCQEAKFHTYVSCFSTIICD